jgi:arylsulfatase A-like enzyme
MSLPVASGADSNGKPVAGARPNIVFILADDLGYGDLGSYGQKRIQTPNVDRLATEGVRFTQFYAGSCVCAPSRNVLMTGQHTGHVQIRGNAKINLRPGDITVAQVLKQAGYATALIGKWGLGSEGSEGTPNKKGFDYFFGYVDQTHAHNYYPAFLVRNETRVPLRNVVPNPGQYGQGVATVKLDYSPDLFAAEALSFIEQHTNQPFFLYFATTIPHANDELRPNGMEVPDLGPYARENWPDPQKGYAAMVTRLDKQVGDLLAKLKQLGLERNTIVVFTSDNGPHREGGFDPAFFNSAGPLRGIKRDLYEGGIREPMIVRWPGHTPAGSVSDHAAYFGDCMATFAEIAGARAPDQLDSVSFLPAMLGKPKEQKEHDYLYWEFYEGATSQAVRTGDWKGVRIPMLTGPIQLFDLGNDLGEQHDVAAAHPDIVERIRAIMDQAHVPSPLWRVPAANRGAATNQ